MNNRHSDEDAQSRSDASSHSMGNVADTEMDVGPDGPAGAENTRQAARDKRGDGAPLQHPPPPPLLPPPAKKKRTRTLTTPHQSAVLHALLAQSRFPTTAMREEVGRSIGLSARKVQVWFQNQRQKARRPRNQGSTAPARPPQYGAFPNAPAPSLAGSTLIPSRLSSDEGGQPPFYSAPSAPFIQFNVNREYSSHENVFGPSSATSASPSSGGQHHLSGPGVPGTSSSFPPRYPQSITPHPLAEPPPPQQPPRDAIHASARQVPSRDFTFNHPFPPLLQVPEAGGASSSPSHSPSPYGRQGQYPSQAHPQTASHSLGLSRPRSQQTSTSPTSTTKTSFTSDSRPQTPALFLVPRHRFESSRDLPRLQIPPLHVPESPHGQHQLNHHEHRHNNNGNNQQQHQHQQQHQQRSVPRYSPPSPLPPVPHHSARFSQQASERPLPLSTSSRSSSRSESHSPPTPATATMPTRSRRFDPVREAASERSASQSTDTSTPPRIDTPHA